MAIIKISHRMALAQIPDGKEEYQPVSWAGWQIKLAKMGVAQHQLHRRAEQHGLYGNKIDAYYVEQEIQNVSRPDS